MLRRYSGNDVWFSPFTRYSILPLLKGEKMNNKTAPIHLIIGRLERYRRENFPELVTGKVDINNDERSAIAISDTTASLIEAFAGFEELNCDESLKKLHRKILTLCEAVDNLIMDGRLADYTYALDLDSNICKIVYELRKLVVKSIEPMTLHAFMKEFCKDITRNERTRCIGALRRADKSKNKPLQPPLPKVGEPKGGGKKGKRKGGGGGGQLYDSNCLLRDWSDYQKRISYLPRLK